MPKAEGDLGPHTSFRKENEVVACVGPFSGQFWKGAKIPLDGRKYDCGGTVFLKNGQKLRASFTVDTTTFDFLNKDSVYICIDKLWFKWDEPEFLEKLNLKKEEAFPFTWTPDRPLDYHEQGSYPMYFFESKNPFK